VGPISPPACCISRADAGCTGLPFPITYQLSPVMHRLWHLFQFEFELRGRWEDCDGRTAELLQRCCRFRQLITHGPWECGTAMREADARLLHMDLGHGKRKVYIFPAARFRIRFRNPAGRRQTAWLQPRWPLLALLARSMQHMHDARCTQPCVQRAACSARWGAGAGAGGGGRGGGAAPRSNLGESPTQFPASRQ
jgi:hypothetical protein